MDKQDTSHKARGLVLIGWILCFLGMWACAAPSGNSERTSEGSNTPEVQSEANTSPDAGTLDQSTPTPDQSTPTPDQSMPEPSPMDTSQESGAPDSQPGDPGSPTDRGAPERPGTEPGSPEPVGPEPAPEKELPEPPPPEKPAPSMGFCPPLPAPGGTIVRVSPQDAAKLPGIVSNAKAGTTILLADGTYRMQGSEGQRRLQFKVARVTLRSASGNPEKVILDGEYKTLEMLTIQADDVTIADLTIRRAVDHLIHVTGSAGHTLRTTLYNLRLIDSGEQFVKVNGDGKGNFADQGRLACSLLRMTSANRPHIERNPGGCYTGGIDAHGAWGWKVQDNTFEGIHCVNGSLAEHAVHFWSASRDTLVERNIIINCARGVGFGLVENGKDRSYPDKPYANVGYKGHIDGIIRNNLIHQDPALQKYYDTGIELAQAHGARVFHNTIASRSTFSSIDYRFANTKATIQNNIVWRITQRNSAKGQVDHNLQNASLSNLFLDASQRNYQLKASATNAIDKGVVLQDAGLDLNGKAHNVGKPDLGAYEYTPKAP